MKKTFNTTGLCFPKRHYMMNTSYQMQEVMDLIEGGGYFTINRPRQFGKTTALYTLVAKLGEEKEYLIIDTSFEGTEGHHSNKAFAQMFMIRCHTAIQYQLPAVLNFFEGLMPTVKGMETLSKAITQLVQYINQEVVLLIDEVDASSNHQSFLEFLAMLRRKYLNREQETTFHSVVLAGVHDTKTLKYKVRGSEEAKYNSPSNITVDFEVRMSFIPIEIVPMLQEYSQAEKVKMDF